MVDFAKPHAVLAAEAERTEAMSGSSLSVPLGRPLSAELCAEIETMLRQFFHPDTIAQLTVGPLDEVERLRQAI